MLVMKQHTLKILSNYKSTLHYSSANVHSSSIRNQINKRYEEIKIPVPWGHIAGKWWGPQNIRPILVLHGWQDSCSTFDPLLNALPEDVAFLACDFPGYGQSSHLPNGIFYHNIDYPIHVRRIQKYFGWPKVSLMGHSRGGMAAFMFAGLYNDDVDMLIAIDGTKPLTRLPEDEVQKMADNAEQFLHYDARKVAAKELPSFTYDELLQKIHSRTDVSLENCKIILDRIIKQSDNDPNKLYFSHDIRTKIEPIPHMQHHDIIAYAERIKCPMLSIKATNSSYFENKEYFYDIINVLQRKNDFQFIKVDGTHHVHINAPKILEKIIREFLQKYNYVDRTAGGFKQEIKCT